ncbi:shikimate dehydrogenase [Streptococcus oricebi]|uniref:Shikimate dehydrogenase (NADP(+)) n=1 Tax=Streptococcus oricebi TaxID=1547447 RepID=A0ABS5B3J6_9STRE|nr:shikimate dehydrogenase [Streptococcus oricebi]MBP2623028.1 shikimate dehydrogenase [Streptococcus oricebi]
MRIDGHTRLAAVVAQPIKHSISPFIHNLAFERLGINGVYLAWEIEKQDLAQTVANIRRYDMYGINLSMPYKQAVIPFLDELSPEARMIGAVNTVINRDGLLLGHNTDGRGFFRSLADFSIQQQKMLILGTGGAATAIIAQAALDGAGAITVFGRSASLERMAARYTAIAEETGVPIHLKSIENRADLEDELASAQLLVNATSLGMDGRSLPIPSDLILPKGLLVADVIYQPFETPFLSLAKAQGLKTVNGLGMLLYQAASAFELWTGQAMPTQLIWQELSKKYQEK